MGTKPHVSLPPVRLDTANQCVWRNESFITLTPKAFTVLRYLIEHAGQLVTKEELLDAAWPGVYVSDAALKVCIRRLRQALNDLLHPPRYIETVHWRGYRFIGPLAVEETLSSTNEEQRHKERSTVDAPEHVPYSTLEPSLEDQSFGVSNTPILVGRTVELQTLVRCLVDVQQRHRRTLFLTGAPGVGKTALVEAFLARAAADPQVWIARGQCIEHYGAEEPYLPVLEALTDMSRSPKGKQLMSVLRRHAPTWLVQMPALLSPTERRSLHREVQGSSRERMLREMAEAVEVLTEDATLILVLEDLHWSDYTTLDLLSFMAHRREPAHLLLLGVYRPDELAHFGHPLKTIKQDLQTHSQCDEVHLLPLTPPMIDSYLAARFPRHEFPSALSALLHRRTGGNPLFLSNMVDHLVARSLLAVDQQMWRMNGTLDDVQSETPTNIQQIIEAQIGRLTLREQHVLEAASVAGIDFSAASVAAALSAEVSEIESCCEELARRGLFLHSQGAGEWPDGTVAARYEFLHSLYQQVWYERVTAGRRVQLHQRLGERGERAYRDRAREIAAELAVHFERGRDLPRAVQHYQHAAENAMRRFGYQEAIAHLSKGLALLSTQADSRERARQEIALQSTLGAASKATQGYAAPAVERAYARVHALCQQVHATAHLDSALRGLWSFHLARAELHTAQAFAEQLLQVAQQTQNSDLLLEADRELGQTLYFLGNFRGAKQYLDRSIQHYDLQQHAAHIFLYGQDPGVVCLVHDARTLCLLGFLDQARQQADKAIRLAQKVAHPFSLALAQYHAAVVHLTCRDVQQSRDLAEATIALAMEHAFPYWLSSAQVLKGWTLTKQGLPDAGIQLMRQGIAAYQAIGAELHHPYSLTLLGEAYGALGKTAEGLTLLGEARQSAARNVGHFHQAEIYRLQGELTLQNAAEVWKLEESPSSHQVANGKRQTAKEIEQEAEEAFLTASAIARSQDAKLLELRATMSVCRLWRRQGKTQEARAQLAPLYAWFTEGLDSLDLQEAKMLLDELG